MTKIENLIVGAGFSGATLARKLAEAGQKVVVVDAKDHIAGNAFDYHDCKWQLLRSPLNQTLKIPFALRLFCFITRGVL
jgi:glycine/D-amino acid oxidase-like deaminating enzyme